MSSSSRLQTPAQLFTAFCLLCVMAMILAGIAPAFAASGLPDSAEFGYGVHIDVWGQQVDSALQAVSAIGIDWIAIDFDWERHWPERSAALDLAELNKIMAFARENELSVLLSITNAPAWVMTPHGPDPELTAGLVAQLARLYPEVLLAVELFPSANTYDGWGSAPDPADYARLIKTTAESLQATSRSTVLVAAGLRPVDPAGGTKDLNDLDFLSGLYRAGVGAYFPIVGVRLPDTSADPLAAPGEDNPFVLRHYEAVRKVMLENEHSAGLIWITGFTWPESLNTAATHTAKSTVEARNHLEASQTQWFNQAFQMMKSQLYIGAAFYNCLNLPANDQLSVNSSSCLIRGESNQTRVHPAYTSLAQMISMGDSGANSFLHLEKILTPLQPKSVLKSGVP